MNYLKSVFIVFASILILQGCKDFLSLQPRGKITKLKTNNNFKTYVNGLYQAFPGYNKSNANSELNSDLFLKNRPNGESEWLWQRKTIPSTSGNWSGPYKIIRKANYMLESLKNAQMSEKNKNHWKAVAYFFRAYEYAGLVNKYGSAPLVTKVLSDTSSKLYGPRTPRNKVTTKILDDLHWAEDHIKPKGSGPNTIDVHCVRAMISRFGLLEGTWRKYHGLHNAKKYLRASANAGKKLMANFSTLSPNYDKVFNSKSLEGVDGIILYKKYVLGQLTHQMATCPGAGCGVWDLTKKAVDKYLMTDGQTRWTSPLFKGDKTPYKEFKNRDKRLYYTVPPPYKIVAGARSRTFEFTNDPIDSTYFSLMKKISDDKHKTLPITNWSGNVVRLMPHFRQDPHGQPFNATFTGYQYYKTYNKLSLGNNHDNSDAPIFRMGEVLINYAEVKYELGEFNQTVADETINKLRARGGVAPLNINNIPNDPTRDSNVSPILWEIRRERAVELMGDGFRFDDLRRWEKMKYAEKTKLGRWITRSNVKNVPIQGGKREGYIDQFGTPPSFPDHYYLYPIPSDQLVLNSKLKQNPGW